MNIFASIDMENVRGVLVDFDNTFYLYEPCHNAAMQAVQRRLKQKIGAIENFNEHYKKAQDIVKKRIPTQAASHSRILYFQTMFENLGRGSCSELSLLLETVYWDTFIKKIRLVPGIRSFLEDCKKRKLKIIIISDLTASIQFRKITALNVGDLVDFVVTSEEAGVEKPGKAIFALALKKFGLRPENVVMIGDDFKKDIQGAENMGIRSIHIVHDQFS